MKIFWQIQYINIQWWMIYNLWLNWNELLLYALIFWYTQDWKNEYHGSLNYISKWLNISKRSAINLLQKLLKKWYIIKTKESYFITSEESLLLVKKVHPSEESSPLASEESSPLASEESSPNINNNINNINNNKEKNIKKENIQLFIDNKEKIINKYKITENELNEEIENFITYWTEKNIKWKQRYEFEKTFEPNKRFTRWLSNNNKWKKTIIINTEDKEKKIKLAEIERKKKLLFNKF